jgi:hypothetical protein
MERVLDTILFGKLFVIVILSEMNRDEISGL